MCLAQLVKTYFTKYLPRGSVDEEDVDRGHIILGTWRPETTGLSDIRHVGSNHCSRQAKVVRN